MKEYGENAGKSGAKLYLTEDEEYVIKTVSKEESEMLSKMAPKYRQHMQGSSLLTVLIGSFGYSKPKEDERRYVVMKNLAPKLDGHYRKYDLKGILLPEKAHNVAFRAEKWSKSDIHGG
uniref:PIPK domain-containing protein n=1 Tax=Ditylenchus dipsaci TaxID=166011 RepID=A0A915DSD6_9BILA